MICAALVSASGSFVNHHLAGDFSICLARELLCVKSIALSLTPPQRRRATRKNRRLRSNFLCRRSRVWHLKVLGLTVILRFIDRTRLQRCAPSQIRQIPGFLTQSNGSASRPTQKLKSTKKPKRARSSATMTVRMWRSITQSIVIGDAFTAAHIASAGQHTSTSTLAPALTLKERSS